MTPSPSPPSTPPSPPPPSTPPSPLPPSSQPAPPLPNPFSPPVLLPLSSSPPSPSLPFPISKSPSPPLPVELVMFNVINPPSNYSNALLDPSSSTNLAFCQAVALGAFADQSQSYLVAILGTSSSSSRQRSLRSSSSGDNVIQVQTSISVPTTSSPQAVQSSISNGFASGSLAQGFISTGAVASPAYLSGVLFPSQSPPPSSSPPSSSSTLGIIIGSVIGGVAAIAVLAIVVVRTLSSTTNSSRSSGASSGGSLSVSKGGLDVVDRAARRHNWSNGRTAMVRRLLGMVSDQPSFQHSLAQSHLHSHLTLIFAAIQSCQS